MTTLAIDPLQAPAAFGTARLLAGATRGQRVDLAHHRALHGDQRHRSLEELADLADRVRLLGRGGAAFPVATKLRAMPTGRATHVVVNGSESEPASRKDRTLMRLVPHLVVDGALLVARALGTAHVTVAVHDAAAAASVRAALRERPDAAAVRVSEREGGFVTGEVRAVLRGLGGGPVVPPGRRVLPHEHGVGGAPTYASNAETFAQLALINGLGAERYAEVGSPDEPGTTLLTLLGDVTHRGVVEVPTGLPLEALLTPRPTASGPVLVGGYHGTWVGAPTELQVTRPSLRAAGAPLNAGVVARLSTDTCALGELVAVGSWLAGESAGQCGPCFFGLPSLARDLHLLLRGTDTRAAIDRRLGLLPGRGACAHPDGAATFVRSGLAAMADEVDVHLRHGSCGRPWVGELPVPTMPVPTGPEERSAR